MGMLRFREVADFHLSLNFIFKNLEASHLDFLQKRVFHKSKYLNLVSLLRY